MRNFLHQINPLKAPLHQYQTEIDTRGPESGPAGDLITVNVEVEVFLRHFVVGAVFAKLSQGFIKSCLQFAIVLTQANTGAISEEFFVFNRRSGKGKIFTGWLLEEAFAGGDLILQGGIQAARVARERGVEPAPLMLAYWRDAAQWAKAHPEDGDAGMWRIENAAARLAADRLHAMGDRKSVV